MKKVWEVVQERLSFPFPAMVLMSSKLHFSLGMVASNENDCSLNRE